MPSPFNKEFWQFTAGFLAILLAGLLGIYFLG